MLKMTITELLKECKISTKAIKCAVYKADGNGVKTVTKELYSLAEAYQNADFDGLYIEVTEDRGFYTLTIYDDCEPCNEIGQYYSDKDAEQLRTALSNYVRGGKGYNRLVETVKGFIANGAYIRNTYIYIIAEHKDFELLQKVRQAKAEYLAEQERQDATKAVEAKAREQVAQEEKERLKAGKVAFLEGYADGKTQIQIERLYDILSKSKYYRSNGTVTRKTRKQFIVDELNEGGRVEKKEGVTTYYGSKWNRKQSKPKTEYRLYSSDERFWTITKTEYDFALYLMQKAA